MPRRSYQDHFDPQRQPSQQHLQSIWVELEPHPQPQPQPESNHQHPSPSTMVPQRPVMSTAQPRNVSPEQSCYHHLVESRLQLREAIIRIKLMSQSRRQKRSIPAKPVLQQAEQVLETVKKFAVTNGVYTEMPVAVQAELLELYCDILELFDQCVVFVKPLVLAARRLERFWHSLEWRQQVSRSLSKDVDLSEIIQDALRRCSSATSKPRQWDSRFHVQERPTVSSRRQERLELALDANPTRGPPARAPPSRHQPSSRRRSNRRAPMAARKRALSKDNHQRQVPNRDLRLKQSRPFGRQHPPITGPTSESRSKATSKPLASGVRDERSAFSRPAPVRLDQPLSRERLHQHTPARLRNEPSTNTASPLRRGSVAQTDEVTGGDRDDVPPNSHHRDDCGVFRAPDPHHRDATKEDGSHIPQAAHDNKRTSISVQHGFIAGAHVPTVVRDESELLALLEATHARHARQDDEQLDEGHAGGIAPIVYCAPDENDSVHDMQRSVRVQMADQEQQASVNHEDIAMSIRPTANGNLQADCEEGEKEEDNEPDDIDHPNATALDELSQRLDLLLRQQSAITQRVHAFRTSSKQGSKPTMLNDTSKATSQMHPPQTASAAEIPDTVFRAEELLIIHEDASAGVPLKASASVEAVHASAPVEAMHASARRSKWRMPSSIDHLRECERYREAMRLRNVRLASNVSMQLQQAYASGLYTELLHQVCTEVDGILADEVSSLLDAELRLPGTLRNVRVAAPIGLQPQSESPAAESSRLDWQRPRQSTDHVGEDLTQSSFGRDVVESALRLARADQKENDHLSQASVAPVLQASPLASESVGSNVAYSQQWQPAGAGVGTAHPEQSQSTDSANNHILAQDSTDLPSSGPATSIPASEPVPTQPLDFDQWLDDDSNRDAAFTGQSGSGRLLTSDSNSSHSRHSTANAMSIASPHEHEYHDGTHSYGTNDYNHESSTSSPQHIAAADMLPAEAHDTDQDPASQTEMSSASFAGSDALRTMSQLHDDNEPLHEKQASSERDSQHSQRANVEQTASRTVSYSDDFDSEHPTQTSTSSQRMQHSVRDQTSDLVEISEGISVASSNLPSSA